MYSAVFISPEDVYGSDSQRIMQQKQQICLVALKCCNEQQFVTIRRKNVCVVLLSQIQVCFCYNNYDIKTRRDN